MDFAPFGIAVVLSLVLFISAWKFGVVDQLSGSLAAAGGIFTGLICYSWFPAFLNNTIGLRLPDFIIIAVALIVGIIALVLLKFIFRGILRALFNADSPLHNLADGFGGALLSLIPITILLFVMASGLRMIGTLMELRMTEHITRPGISWVKGNYPKWPLTTKWRDQIESVPLVSNLLGMVDPISKKQVRNLTGLVIASQNAPLRIHLEKSPETSGIVGSEAYAEVIADETVIKLDEKNNRPGLLRNSTIIDAANSTEIRSELRKLSLRKLIDDYMLSPEKLQDSESRQRPIDPKAKPSTDDPFG